MALLNDIKKMQSEGKTEQEIIATMRQQGVSPKDIIEALSQSKIKEAVTGAQETQAPAPSPQDLQQEALMPGTDVMPNPSPDMQASPTMSQPMESPQQMPEQSAYPQQPQQMQPAYQEYPQYQQQYAPQAGSISPDTITEISEQVVSEKLSTLKKDIEQIIDMKTTVESKIEYFDERLKRIEKIIDRLQLSIMQKVGDYMTNIDDIKKEIVETQKSFKALTSSESPREKPKKTQQQESE